MMTMNLYESLTAMLICVIFGFVFGTWLMMQAVNYCIRHGSMDVFFRGKRIDKIFW